jgi:septin family protein
LLSIHYCIYNSVTATNSELYKWTVTYFQVRQLKEAVPFAVCGANTLLEVRGRKVRGRLYPWGVVEVENPDHCDFIKLRTMLM